MICIFLLCQCFENVFIIMPMVYFYLKMHRNLFDKYSKRSETCHWYYKDKGFPFHRIRWTRSVPSEKVIQLILCSSRLYSRIVLLYWIGSKVVMKKNLLSLALCFLSCVANTLVLYFMHFWIWLEYFLWCDFLHSCIYHNFCCKTQI